MPRLAALLCLMWTVTASARWWPAAPTPPTGHVLPPTAQESREPAERVAPAGAHTPAAAARIAQKLNGGGRVLSVEPAAGGWRVKLLKDGDVRIVFVPD